MAQLNRITKPVKGGLNKLVTSSPELEEVVNRIRGELFEALAEASRQIGSLSTRLQDRAEALQHAADVAAGLEETARGAASGVKKTATRGVSRSRDTAAGPAKQRRPRAAELEPQDDEESEDEEPRSRSRVQRDQPSPGSRPIRRARG